jgi:transcriptional regulator with XRE-family HTH domain
MTKIDDVRPELEKFQLDWAPMARLRKRTGTSQARLAKLALGATGSCLSNYERGVRSPSTNHAVALARAMGTPLLGGLCDVVELKP